MKLLFVLPIFLLISFKSISVEPNIWLRHYYQKPSSEKFVAEVRRMSKHGFLSDPKRNKSIAVFISQLLVANPEQTKDWLSSLQSISTSDLNTLHYAAGLASTKESKSYLASVGENDLLTKNPTNFLTLEIKNPQALDALWHIFTLRAMLKQLGN